MNVYFAVGAMALAVGSLTAAYMAGSHSGAQDERAVWTQREKARDDAAEKVAKEQALKMDRLYVEIETLRAQPERVRTITRLVEVKPDAQCESLPSDWRSLWSAGSVPDATSDRGQAASGSRMGDGSVPAVADDRR